MRATRRSCVLSFNIAFVLFPGFEELDFVGPYEVLAATAKHIDEAGCDEPVHGEGVGHCLG